MENSVSSATKYILGGFLSVFLLSVVTAILFFSKVVKLRNENEIITSKTDSLQLVKDKLAYQIEDLSKELEMEKTDKESLQLTINSINGLLAEKQTKISQLKKEVEHANKTNASTSEKVQLLTNQITELSQLKNSMEANLSEMQINSEALSSENKSLKNEVSHLNAQNGELKSEIYVLNQHLANVRYAAPADNFKIETLKRNEKVTAKAKKVKTIQVSFLIPDDIRLGSQQTEVLYLTIVDKDKNPIPGVIKTMRVNKNAKVVPIDVHASLSHDFSKKSDFVNFTFEVDERLKPGTYSMSIFSEDDYYGTAEFTVAKSFWMF